MGSYGSQWVTLGKYGETVENGDGQSDVARKPSGWPPQLAGRLAETRQTKGETHVAPDRAHSLADPGAAAGRTAAQELITKKQVFELASFTTQSGRTLKNVKVGWESYGTLNADKSNAILICHFFTGNVARRRQIRRGREGAGLLGRHHRSRQGDRYEQVLRAVVRHAGEPQCAGDPNVTTTGPASIDPDTGKPYGLSFPVVSIRDFIEVQKKLVDSLGIKKLVMVGGASMGGLQTYEWAGAYPDMVGRIMPVIASAEADAGLLAWADIWSAPIRLDPKWNGGDYYGKEPPLAGLGLSLKLVTLHTQTHAWAHGRVRRQVGQGGRQPGQGLREPLRRGRDPRRRRCRPRQGLRCQQLHLSGQGQPAVRGGRGRAPEGDQGAGAHRLQPHRRALPGRVA